MPHHMEDPTPQNGGPSASRHSNVHSTSDDWQALARTLKKVQSVGRLGYWKLAPTKGELHWSDVLYDIFGIDENQFTPDNDTFLAMVHPQDRKKVAEKLARVYEDGKHEITYRIVRPDGMTRWVYEIAENSVHDDPYTLVGAVRDITEHKELEEKLERQAITDELTGLYNRRHFMERLQQAFALHRRGGHPVVVLMLDIDHFKAVNDTYGHAMGDLVLKQVSELFRERFRQTDVVGRLGGEEFAVLMFDIGMDDAVELAEAMREAIASTEFGTEEGDKLRVLITCGVAGFGKHDDNEHNILQRADEAMYRGKRSGRNRVVTEAHYESPSRPGG